MPLNGVPCSAPAFSWTAHTAQGQTLPAAIVDMQIGAGTSPMASYVAFTRVKRAEDLLIFRPFDRALFCQGNLEGPELLLRVLRGEAVDWQAIEEKHMPSNMCHDCDTKTFKGEFSEAQWKRKDGKRICKNCERLLGHSSAKKNASGAANGCRKKALMRKYGAKEIHRTFSVEVVPISVNAVAAKK